MISFISGANKITAKADISLTKQVASFFELKIKGDYSINFRITNNSETREALGIYSVNDTSNLRQDWDMYSDLNKIAKGELVVQSIGKEIELFFISGNANWISNLIETTTLLNLVPYARSWDEAAVTTRGRTSGIVYPLCDWAYSFQKTTGTFRTLPITDSGDNQFVDFYPCFYLKDMVKEIIQQSGFKMTGDVLNDTRYKKMIITPAKGEIKRNEKFLKDRTVSAYKSATQTVGSANTYTKVTFPSIVSNSTLLANDRYTTDTNYIFGIECNFSVSVDQAYTAAVYVDGVLSETKAFSGVEGLSVWTNLEAIKNRYFEIYLKSDSGGTGFNININSSLTITPDEVVIPRSVGTEYVYPNDFINMKCIDVLKFVAVYFGCYVYFDEYSKTLTFNRVDKITDSVDWSEYLKSFEAVYDARTAQSNYIRLADPVDDNILIYNSRNLTGFGEGNLQSDTDLNANNDLYKAPFASAESRITVKYAQLLLPYIGLVELEDDNEYSEYATVTDVADIAQFNGEGFNLTGGEVIRIVDTAGIYSGYHVVSSADYNTVQSQGMGFKGTSSGVFYKQKANFLSGSNRILLYNPDTLVSAMGAGDSASGGVVYRHTIELDVTEAVVGSPAYQAQYDNTLYSNTLNTVGTATDTGLLRFLDNVTVYVSRTGNAADVVQVYYYRNGILENTAAPITAGNPVNINYTFASTIATDDFKVVITEG